MWITRDKFLDRVKELNSNYWNEGKDYRWEYMSAVIQMGQRLEAEKIIEAGASDIPLNNESYLFSYPEHDLDKVPYKFNDKHFDLFIALQTWEHLTNQQEAFKEVMRISKHAILSFPYKWKHGDAQHRDIDERKIEKWTCGVKPVQTMLIKNRIIYRFKF